MSINVKKIKDEELELFFSLGLSSRDRSQSYTDWNTSKNNAWEWLAFVNKRVFKKVFLKADNYTQASLLSGKEDVVAESLYKYIKKSLKEE